MKIIKIIPSLITCLNLSCGAIAVIFALQNQPQYAACLILLATVFDFLDGFAARLLKAYSELGKQLDSLADLISFGLAPTMIVYSYVVANNIFSQYAAFGVIILLIASALRLAIFNIDDKQTTEFRGLPTPATALFIISLFANFKNNFFNIEEILNNEWTISIIIISLSILMLAPIKLMSLKIKKFNIKEHFWQLILTIIAICIFAILKMSGLYIIIITYIIISLIKNITNKKYIS